MQHLAPDWGCIFDTMKGTFIWIRTTASLGLLLLATGCSDSGECLDPVEVPTALNLVSPPTLGEPKFPEDNAFDDVRWALGKALFFDQRLSLDGAVSCATCHVPEKAFSAPEAVTPGAFGATGERNSATLTNVAYQPHFMSEGGVPTLEMQVLVPLQEPTEMAHNIVTVCEELAIDYEAQAMNAYGRGLDPFVMTRALATFERSLLSGNSTWDQWQNGGAVEAAVERGYALFGGDGLGCDRCHAPPLFTTHGFANNGLEGVSVDPGRWRVTGEPADSGAFKIPTLRNIGFTAPYMHDGRFEDLNAVVNHYASGGEGHAHQDTALAPFALDEQEHSDLLAFLFSLNDTAFVNDARWQP